MYKRQTSPFVAGVILDSFPGVPGYRLFFIYMFAVTIFGLVLTLIWLRMTKARRAEILAALKKKDSGVVGEVQEA